MNAFNRVKGVAAPLPLANLDTDKILPGRFLKTVSRFGLGDALFHSLRFDERGAERQDFILNREPWRRASILIALENFGCGSSREHAPWALVDFGIRCIIAPSFAEIFYNNCFKNGMLPIVLERQIVERLMKAAADPRAAELEVDLGKQIIAVQSGETISFNVPAARREALLQGRDDIARTLQYDAAICAHEKAARPEVARLPKLVVE